jgi:hypothetical protein
MLRRAAASSGRLGPAEERSAAEIFWDQVGVLAQPIAGSLDVDNDGMVEQAIEQRGGHNRMTEDAAPFGEAAV